MSAALLAAGALLAGCVLPDLTSSPSTAYVYVANSVDGTVARLERQTGRPIGSPLPAGTAPTQLAAGPGGSLLALSTWPTAPHGADRLTHIVRLGGGWRARPLDLGAPAYGALLAGDGGRYALLAYHLVDFIAGVPQPSEGPCRLALIDVAAGVVERTHSVCSPHESVTAVALASRPAGMISYLGIWHGPGEGGTPRQGRDRVVALDAASGAVLAVAPLAGFPSDVAYVPGRWPGAERLYCIEHTSFLAYDTSTGTRTRLLALDPDTLQIEREIPLRDSPLHIAVAPDGEQAYALTAGGSTLVRIDLATGVESPPVSLPGLAYALAVTETWVYITQPKGSALWLLDRQRGTVAKTIRLGGQPAGLALSGRT